MRNPLLLTLCLLLILVGTSYGQLTGVKAIPGDYPTIASAIADLNSSGVGTGGVTFNVNPGYTETFTSSTDGYITTTTGSATNPVVFKKTGPGVNPLITAGPGAGTMDAIIAIAGCDYVTFDGINLQENSGNTTATLQMEWGYALLKNSNTDGTQNATIKNCVITLNITNTGSVGIYSANHTTASITPLTLQSAAGPNSNMKLYSNTIHCYTGIRVTGFNDIVQNNFSYYDQNNEIGKDGANTITNIAGQNIIGYGIYSNYQNNLKVANNIITSTTAGTATSIYGIYLIQSNNANYDVYGNTVSIQYSGPGNSSLYPIWAEMGAAGQYNTINIYNNTITNCTFPTFTSGTVRFLNIANGGVNVNVYGNTISNNTIGTGSVTATGNIYYLVVNKNAGVYGPLNLYNNTVSGNSRLQLTPASSITYFIWSAGSALNANIHHNTVTNNTVTSFGSTYGISSSLSIASTKIYDNTISNLTQVNGVFQGIAYSSSSNNVITEIYRNNISNIQGDIGGSASHGIYVSGSGTANSMHIYNNMISDLRAPIATTGATIPLITGIHISAANYINAFHNTVYLNSTSSGVNFGTAAFYAPTNTQGIELRNNIFVNTSTPVGTGVTAAIRFSGGTITNFALTSNNNLLYAGVPGPSNVIFSDGTNKDQTLAAYQSRMYPREIQSATEMPPFVNTTSGSTNLHLQPAVATQCESGGSPLIAFPVTTDYDLNPRFPNPGYPVGAFTPVGPDMGADEFGGISVDLAAPAITYTPLIPVNHTNARTLTVTITDRSGVPTSGAGLPMLYWKVNAGSYTGVQAMHVSGNTYSFTFGSGTATGDVVSYYVVAQDLVTTPNITCKPFVGASGFTSNPPACSTPPTTPDSYTIVANYSGTFHVGVGKDYVNLTAAAADFNSKVLTGPVTYILDDATYPTEVFPIMFNSNAGSSAVNTLTIKPNTGVSPVFEADVTSGIIDLNGVDYATIDGSNSGSNSKNLTISNPKTLTNGTYCIAIKSSGSGGVDPATNITIKNCILKNVRLDQTSAFNACIRILGVAGSYENIIIDNNVIMRAFTGVQIWGSAAAKAKNIQVTNNTIGSTVAADAISKFGVDVQFADNTLVENNEIMGPIDGSISPGQAGVVISNFATNTKVRRNNIHTFWRSADDGWGCYGIYFLSDASTVTEISNNVIYDIHSGGSAGGVALSNTYGILARNGGNMKIVHNSINLTGPYLSATLDASSGCIGFWQQVQGNNEIRNNILRNSQTMIGGATPFQARAYGIMINGTASLFSNIDNNNYYIDGVNGSVGHVFTMQQYLYFPTVASWQAYTGQEANSVDFNPDFTSATNLLPTNELLNNKGAYMPSVPNDITGALRSNPSDIGAYEFGNDPKVITLSKSSVTYNSATILGTANAAATTLSSYFDYGTTTSYGTSLAATPSSVTGTSNTPIQLSLTGLLPLTTYHYRARGMSSTGQEVYGVDSVFTTKPLPPTVITTSATDITSSGATGNGTVNANGGLATITLEYGLSTSYGSTVVVSPISTSGFTTTAVLGSITGLTPYTTYHYRIVATNEGGTTYGNDITFTTLPVPSTVITLPATNLIGANATLNGSVNANYAPTNVSFEWGLTTSYGNTATATPASVSGSTATAISADITGLVYATTYHYRAVGNGPGGLVYGNDLTFISDCPLPAAPATINGLTSVCKNASSVNYSVAVVSGATTYNWTVPSGAIITSGSGTNSITVNFNSTAVSGNVTASVSSLCGTGPVATLPVTVYELTVPAISGTNSACFNSTNNSYTTETGMSNYTWTITGGTITSGTGTSGVAVTWSSVGNQSINVNYTDLNGCTNNNATQYPVTVNALPVPTITGNNVACESTIELDYTTQTGMTNYVWALSANSGTITENNGSSVTVFWTLPGNNSISVSYTDVNGCTAANPTVYNVTVNPLPGTPGSISGPASVCAGATGINYTVATIPNTTYYFWLLPAGATIASGTGTNSIMVNFSNDAASGNITVQGQNDCGSGSFSQPLSIIINSLPLAAGTITGQTTVCQGETEVSYSVEAIVGATSYLWTLPAGATITSGANTNAITVSYGYSAVSGNVSVQGVNACGNGTAATLAVVVNSAPATPVITIVNTTLSSSASQGNQWYLNGNIIPGATNQTYTVTENGVYNVIVTINGCSSQPSNEISIINIGNKLNSKAQVLVYPNPSSGSFWIELKTDNQEEYQISLMNSNGSIVKTMDNELLTSGNKVYFEQNNLASGIYFLSLRSKSDVIVKMIEIVK